MPNKLSYGLNLVFSKEDRNICYKRPKAIQNDLELLETLHKCRKVTKVALEGLYKHHERERERSIHSFNHNSHINSDLGEL